MAREITYLTDVFLITCVVESGIADKIIDAATSVGAQGATINYARGTGVRDRMGLLGVTIDEQKEIIRIIVSKEQSNSCLLYTSPSPRDVEESRMPSSA